MSASIKIIVSGSNGQLGSELKERALNYTNASFVFTDRDELSITDNDALEKMFALHQPQYFINCAAYTAVDRAEEEKEAAFEINGTAVGHLAHLCKQYNCRLIHISTDYVFNGKTKEPLNENALVAPLNVYGESKLAGEELAIKNNQETIIIRTSWVYSFYGKNFVKTMMRLMKEKQSINVVSDQVGSPTYAADLADAILEIIFLRKWAAGIYNYSNEGVISWYQFAEEIKNLIKATCNIYPITTEQYPTPAERPAYSVLDKTKINKTFQIQLKDWKESLKNCINKLQQNI